MCKGLETLSIGEGICTGLNCGKSHSTSSDTYVSNGSGYNISNAISGAYFGKMTRDYSPMGSYNI